MIKSLILYGSHKKLTSSHRMVTVPSQGLYFVRSDTSDLPFEEALDKAKPMEGETVLNTVPVVEEWI